MPIPALLRSELRRHLLHQGRGGVGLVFSSDGQRPFDLSNTKRAARAIWRAAGLEPLGFQREAAARLDRYLAAELQGPGLRALQ